MDTEEDITESPPAPVAMANGKKKAPPAVVTVPSNPSKHKSKPLEPKKNAKKQRRNDDESTSDVGGNEEEDGGESGKSTASYEQRLKLKLGYRRKATLLRKLVEFEKYHDRDLICIAMKPKHEGSGLRSAALAYVSPGLDRMKVMSIAEAFQISNLRTALASSDKKAPQHRARPAKVRKPGATVPPKATQ